MLLALLGGGVCSGLQTPDSTAAPAEKKTIYEFAARKTGNNPINGTLIMDSSGALYGTTSGYGDRVPSKAGTVYKLSPPVAGKTKWTLTTLYYFNKKKGSDGDNTPIGGVVMDADGNLFGTTFDGDVFELSPPEPGNTTWTQQILASLGGTSAGLLLGPGGALFGAVNETKSNIYGYVFELTPPQPGQTTWTDTTIWDFSSLPHDGATPRSLLIEDSFGNLYGTTLGGSRLGGGTVFELSPPAPGQTAWSETILHEFNSRKPEGGEGPSTSLLLSSSGQLFGATAVGGKNNGGVAFEITPPSGGQ